MIKNVHGIGQYLVVYNNSASNYINNYMRFNTSNQTMEVYDGAMWQTLKMGEITVSLTQDAVEALDWVNQKRAEESRLQELAKKYPAVADQMAAVCKAEEKLRMIADLVEL